MIRVTSNAHFIVVHHVAGGTSFTLSPLEASQLIERLAGALGDFGPIVNPARTMERNPDKPSLDAQYAWRVVALMEDYNLEFAEAFSIVREVDFIGE